jgi:hypothetical protein
MTIETSPAHHRDAAARLLPRLSLAGVLSALLVVVTWTTLTVAHEGRLVSSSVFAATPARVRHGELWLLVTSGLLVQRPIVVSLLAFVALAILAIAFCGAKVMWLCAVIGHVFSTVIVYGLLAAVTLVDPHAFASLQHAPDYGVSAIAAAWLGAIACTAWSRRGASLRGKAAVILSCAAVAVFAWMVERHMQRRLTFLDSEHGFAFALGLLVVRNPWSIASQVRLPFLGSAAVLDTDGESA